MKINIRTKLVLFSLALVLSSILVIFSFYQKKFEEITSYSLDKNRESIERITQVYLQRIVQEKVKNISLQLKKAINDVTILGKTGQRIIDNLSSSDLATLAEHQLFTQKLKPYKGALTNDGTEEVNILIPQALVDKPITQAVLKQFSLLKLVLPPVFEASSNNTVAWFQTGPECPIFYGYPYFNVAEQFGENLNKLVWIDWWPENPKYWTRFFSDNQFQKQILEKTGTPVTFEPPYDDAGGKGKIITLFYPWWDSKNQKFAGAAGLDISLNKIVNNILSIRIAKSGYAFLINGKGDIIAMPDIGYQQLKIHSEQQTEDLTKYIKGSLLNSDDKGIQSISHTILNDTEDFHQVSLDNNERQILVHASLSPINDPKYHPDIWKIVLVVPEKEIFAALFKTQTDIKQQSLALSLTIGLLTLFTLITITLLTIFFSGRVTANIKKLSAAASNISVNDFNVQVQINSKDEIGYLADSFNYMTARLAESFKQIEKQNEQLNAQKDNLEIKVELRTRELKRAKETTEAANQEITRLNEQLKSDNLRMSAELDVSRQLQQMLLPKNEELEAVDGLDIAGFMEPADEVGGDYYDVLQHQGRVLFGIGDVTGHGLESGALAIMVQSAVRALLANNETDPVKFFSALNQMVFHNVQRMNAEKSLTLALVDYKDNQLYLSGQHEQMIVVRSGKLELIDTMDLGFLVGLEEDIAKFVHQATVPLNAGDVVVLYTDGITEAFNMKKTEYGLERLCEIIQQNWQQTAKKIQQAVIDDVRQFIGEQKVYDDMTLLVLKQK